MLFSPPSILWHISPLPLWSFALPFHKLCQIEEDGDEHLWFVGIRNFDASSYTVYFWWLKWCKWLLTCLTGRLRSSKTKSGHIWTTLVPCLIITSTESISGTYGIGSQSRNMPCPLCSDSSEEWIDQWRISTFHFFSLHCWERDI